MPTAEEQAEIDRNARIAAANQVTADRTNANAGATGANGEGTNSAGVNTDRDGDPNAERADPAKNQDRTGAGAGEIDAAARGPGSNAGEGPGPGAAKVEGEDGGSWFSRVKTNVTLADGRQHHIRFGHQKLPAEVAALKHVTGEGGLMRRSSDVSKEETEDFERRLEMGLLGATNDGFSGPVVNVPHGVAAASGYHDARHMAECGGGVQAYTAPVLEGPEDEDALEAERQAAEGRPAADPVTVPPSNQRMDRRGRRGR